MVSSWKDNWKDNFRACKVKKPTVQTTTDNKRAEMAINWCPINEAYYWVMLKKSKCKWE